VPPELTDPTQLEPLSTQRQSTQQVAKPGVSLAIIAAIACLAQFMVVLDSSARPSGR
jgi:hypothetical protein